jgi:hypothetical protein
MRQKILASQRPSARMATAVRRLFPPPLYPNSFADSTVTRNIRGRAMTDKPVRLLDQVRLSLRRRG